MSRLVDRHRVARILARITLWGTLQPDIHALFLVGSHARGTASPDSDIDLVLVCQDPRSWLRDKRWVRVLGTPREISVEDWGLVTSLRVVYTDGSEIEFGLTTLRWVTPPIDSGTAQVIQSGIRPLHDPGGRLARAKILLR